MFNDWFGFFRNSQVESDQSDRAHATADQPCVASCDPGSQDSPGVLLLRQPVISSFNRIIGWDLGWGRNNRVEEPVLVAPVQRDETAQVVRLAKELTEKQQLFVRVSLEMLTSGQLAYLPIRQVVLALDMGQIDDFVQTAELCHARVQEGWRFAWDDLPDNPAAQALLPLASFLRFDLRCCDALEMEQRIHSLRESLSIPLIASRVETEDDYEAARVLGFDHFQGAFFTHMRPLLPRRVGHDRMRVIRLLNLVGQRAELPELEAVIKHDAMLSYRLLSYINSPSSGLDHPLDSISQAVMFLGYEPLYRWLAVLLFISDNTDVRDRLLLPHALVRARLCELLAGAHLSSRDAASLFVVGMFSLLDALFNMPMEQAIETLNLAEPIRQALLRGTGVYGDYLHLVLALESMDELGAGALARKLGLGVEQINPMQIEAMAWASALDHLPET